MEIWSSDTGEPPLTVILAVRRLVFICGETDAIVPWMIVPAKSISIRMCNAPGGEGRVSYQS